MLASFFKKYFLIAGLFLSAGILTCFFSCAQLTKDLLKDPDVKVLDFVVSNVTAESVSVNVRLNVNNPNPIPLTVGQVNYNLKLSGQQVTEGIFDQGINVPASGASDVVIPFTFKFNALEGLLNGFLKKTLTKDYELNGSAKVGLFSIPFHKKGEINLKK